MILFNFELFLKNFYFFLEIKASLFLILQDSLRPNVFFLFKIFRKLLLKFFFENCLSKYFKNLIVLINFWKI